MVIRATSSLARLLGVRRPLDAPVEDIIVLVTLADKEVAEEFAQVAIVGLVVKAEGTAIVEENAEFIGEAATEQVGRSGHLLLHNTIVLLLLGGSLETLPRELSTQEVHEDVSE